MANNGGRRSLLTRVEKLQKLAAESPPSGPVRVHPWMEITDIPKFLVYARIQAQDIAESKPPIGYPVTNAAWEDFIKAFEVLERALNGGDSTPPWAEPDRLTVNNGDTKTGPRLS